MVIGDLNHDLKNSLGNPLGISPGCLTLKMFVQKGIYMLCKNCNPSLIDAI